MESSRQISAKHFWNLFIRLIYTMRLCSILLDVELIISSMGIDDMDISPMDIQKEVVCLFVNI